MTGSIGFTDDGKVFMTSIGQTPEGKKAQLTFLWEPKEALRIADMLTYSAKQVDKPLLVRPPSGLRL